MKTALFLLGPGSAGKSSIRKHMCGDQPTQTTVTTEFLDRFGNMSPGKYHVTVYPNNYVLCGSKGNGTDANVSPDLIKQSFASCLKHDREVIIFDGCMASPKWPLFCNDLEVDHVLVVHLNYTIDTVLERLAHRRTYNQRKGTEKEFMIHDSTRRDCLSFIQRAINCVNAFKNTCTKPMTFTEFSDPKQTVAEISQKIEEVLNGLSISTHR